MIGKCFTCIYVGTQVQEFIGNYQEVLYLHIKYLGIQVEEVIGNYQEVHIFSIQVTGNDAEVHIFIRNQCYHYIMYESDRKSDTH